MEDSPQHRILTAAEAIIATSGVEAATTRSVALAAGVQAPTIYRYFGDKDGLLRAVAKKVLADYARAKGLQPRDPDPVAALRAGWDAHVAFALQHPDIFRIMLARDDVSPALAMGSAVLQGKIADVALAGRLRLTQARALDLFHAAATGLILLYLRQRPQDRDMGLSQVARDAVLAALTGVALPQTITGAARAAQALRVRLPDVAGLSAGERLLLIELLDRIAS